MTIKAFDQQNLLKRCNEMYKKRSEDSYQFDWQRQARPNQLPPEGDWRIWLIIAGRGFGKTRTGAETIRMWVEKNRYHRIALIGGSVDEVRDVMVEGESGLLNIYPEYERPLFEPSKRKITWANGTVAHLYGANHYEKLRGPQFDLAWVDELAKFRYSEETWNQLMLGLRLGNDPRCLVTTTPRPQKLLQNLLESPDSAVTRGTTFDNEANLAPTFLKQILKQFDGTSLGAQELYAEILTERQGALWQRSMIHYQQPATSEDGQYLFRRIVIAIDPATTHHQESDETGMVVAALGEDNQAYILEDLSGRYSPADWGRRAIEAYWRYKADRVVAEVNKGGDMVERILRSIDPSVSYKAVRATRGKATRAEPIAALYEQNRVYHIRPLTTLETQLCDYIPGVTSKSPDRLDALVWGLTDLLLEAESNPVLKIWGAS